ncbi:MAG TPA: hypothetical protein VJS63_05410 [Bradyrhizobium sp.]|nr:hypothetical protein [Bradyrhizobium sp.]
MRHSGFALALLTLWGAAGAIGQAAEIELPSRRVPEHVSIQQGPPNCSRWTDDCVNCSREPGNDAPVCSNVGVACQPKAIRCLGPVASPAK